MRRGGGEVVEVLSCVRELRALAHLLGGRRAKDTTGVTGRVNMRHGAVVGCFLRLQTVNTRVRCSGRQGACCFGGSFSVRLGVGV